MASACATNDHYPPEWHSASDSVHVFGALPSRTIAMPAGGEDVTVLEFVTGLGDTGCDLSHVVVFRRSGPDMLQVAIDVKDMIRTGNTVSNIVLRPGDVVELVE